MVFKYLKLNMKSHNLADDTSIILDGTEESLKQTLKELDWFAGISGLRINFSKTQVVWIGSKKYSTDILCQNWQLSWGKSSFKVLGIEFDVDLGIMSWSMKTNIAVIGAGVVGLSTAIHVKTLFPHSDITVIADKFNADTTSYGAGGIFLITTDDIPGVPEAIARKWILDSWEWFSNMAQSDLASETGTQFVSGFFLRNNANVNFERSVREITYSCSILSNAELKKLKMIGRYKYGYGMATVIMCCSTYLPWLTNRWLKCGGIIESKHIKDLNELVGKYDIVVNCTGLGSRTLFHDNKVVPARGQLIRVKADWIKCWMFTDDGTYIIPNGNMITIGGTRQKDNSNIKIDERDRMDIMKRCTNLWPPLKGCTVVQEWVGLRPTRVPLRLEPEMIHLKNGILKVVHNYGHGANGIALSWGTGKHAASLVEEMLTTLCPQI